MKQKLLVKSLFFVLFACQLSQSQNTSSEYLVRATTGILGSSENVSLNNKSYLVQQSIGQASAIGTFYNSDYIVRQGFIQPNVMSKIIAKGLPLSLEAVVYPNPFIQNITISFTEQISGKVEVAVFDVFGQFVFSQSYSANQKINVQVGNIAVANYLLRITANNKQFIKKILKR